MARQHAAVPDRRFYDANFYNEERELGLPRMFLQALASHDYVRLFELGSHNFLLLTAEHDYAPTVLVKVAAPAFERHDNGHGIDVPRRRMTGSAA
jgi:hypothetical protein